MKAGFGEWVFKTIDYDQAIPLSENLGISVYTSQLLLNRGITSKEEALEFLNVPNQLIMESWDKLKSEAIGKRLLEAINKKELITVHGDYDVDGVTGAAVLCQFLKSKGATFNFFLPDRFGDGYGLSSNTIKVLGENGTKIIITADCGISNVEEVKLANELGIEVIITDHHTLPEILPEAKFIFHPGLVEDKKFHILSGVGTAFQLISDINLIIPSVYDVSPDDYLDLVTIGTIADISPLKGINRALVQYGLTKIKNTKRIGLLILMENAGIKPENFSATDISFKIVPRLNAAGRMNKATQALELLISETEEQALELAKKLESLNKQRQELCEKTFLEIEELIANEVNLENDKAIVIAKDGFHHGVIGILCSRILEKYHCPVFIMAIEGEHSRGSARSTNLHLVDALKSASDYLIKYGGHKGAAGWSLKTSDLEKFKEIILEFAKENISDNDLKNKLNVEVEIPIQSINYQLYRELQDLGPFGESNPFPVIGIRDCQITEQYLSKNGAHLFFNVKGENKDYRTTFWNAAHFYPLNEKIDLIFNIVENNWRNKISLELKAVAVRNSQFEKLKQEKLKKFQAINRNDTLEIEFPVNQLIYKPADIGYLTNFTGQHQINFPENINHFIKKIKIIDYRNSINSMIKLSELFSKLDVETINIYSSKKFDLPENLKDKLKEISTEKNTIKKKNLIIWDLPLKKEHLHHIMNIVDADNIYMFFKENSLPNKKINSTILKEVLKNLYVYSESMNDFIKSCIEYLELTQLQLSQSLTFLIEAKYILEQEGKNFIKLLNKGVRLSELESYNNYAKEETKYNNFYNLMLWGSINKISNIVEVKI